MKFLICISLLTCCVQQAAFSSVGFVLQTNKISIAAQDPLHHFDEIGATLETTGTYDNDNNYYRIKSIELLAKGKSYVVPQDQLKELAFPNLRTAVLLSGEKENGPYCGVDFEFSSRGVTKRARILFCENKLEPVQIFSKASQ